MSHRVKVSDFSNCPVCGIRVKKVNLQGHMRGKCSTRAYKRQIRDKYWKEKRTFYAHKTLEREIQKKREKLAYLSEEMGKKQSEAKKARYVQPIDEVTAEIENLEKQLNEMPKKEGLFPRLKKWLRREKESKE